MAYKWPNKDPDEILDYSVDWSRFLGSAIISSVTWFIDDADEVKTEFGDTDTVNGLQKVTQTETTTTATIRLALGTNNVQYKLYCQMTDDQGLTAERAVTIRIRNN